MITCTMFDSIYDNKTHKVLNYKSFDEFETILFKLASMDKYKTKSSAPLISPAVYEDNSTRANDNVVKWTKFAILDVDNYEGKFEDIKQKYNQYKYVCYSTASSTAEKPKFRLVFPLTSEVHKENIKHFWYALNKEIGDIADVQTKDISRMFYVPSQYENAHNFIFSHDGKIIDPYELMQKHPYVEKSTNMIDRLPPAIRNALIEYKKSTLTNTNYSWTDYSDCPFVNKRQVEEYKSITETGWYFKMYEIMVTIAGNAMSKGYPITAKEVEYICRSLDYETGGWYGKRPMDKEAQRAIDFVFKNSL